MTLHSPQVHGFFSVPVDHLHALRELAESLPQPGPVRRGGGLARPRLRQRARPRSPGWLGLPVAAGAKAAHQRPRRCAITSIIGDVDGRDVIVLDDEIARGTTSSSCSTGSASTGAVGPHRLHPRAVLPTARWRRSPPSPT